MIAGCLHRLGVDMGAGHLQRADHNNPRGYYEDRRWQHINKMLAGNKYSAQRVWSLPERWAREYDDLARQCSQKALWGIKGPRMAFTFQHLWPIVARYAEVRVVRVRRDREAVIQSLMQHSRKAYRGQNAMSHPQAKRLAEAWAEALDAALETFDGAVLDVRYEDVIGDPEQALLHLCEFGWAGIQRRPDPSDGFENALKFVDPSLRHHGAGQ